MCIVIFFDLFLESCRLYVRPSSICSPPGEVCKSTVLSLPCKVVHNPHDFLNACCPFLSDWDFVKRNQNNIRFNLCHARVAAGAGGSRSKRHHTGVRPTCCHFWAGCHRKPHRQVWTPGAKDDHTVCKHSHLRVYPFGVVSDARAPNHGHRIGPSAPTIARVGIPQVCALVPARVASNNSCCAVDSGVGPLACEQREGCHHPSVRKERHACLAWTFNVWPRTAVTVIWRSHVCCCINPRRVLPSSTFAWIWHTQKETPWSKNQRAPIMNTAGNCMR